MSIRLESVSMVSMGESVMSDVSLTLERGTMNVLLGPTLAGKTTLMRLMAGLDKPTSGRILVYDKDVTGVPVRERSVAMVYQEFVNYPSFTVYENIAAPLRRAKRLPARQVDAKVKAIAQMMRIDHLLHRLPSELSGGQQQRVALARALVKEAPLLLLDEPLVNLDYKLREELRSEIREIFHRGATTVVYATTEPQEALLFGGNTIVLDAGRVLQCGPALEIYHRPETIRASQVFSDPPINLIRAVIGPHGCRLSPSVAFPLAQHMRALPPGDYRMGVRANHIGLTGHAEHGVKIPAKVELAEINGSETYVHAGHGDFQMIAVLQGVHQFGLGDEINLYLDPRLLFVFDSAGNLVAAPAENPGGTGTH